MALVAFAKAFAQLRLASMGNVRRVNWRATSSTIPLSSVVAEPAPDSGLSAVASMLIHSDGTSTNKYYNVVRTGSVVELHWGRCGAGGQKSLKHFTSEAGAIEFARKTTAEKLRKGYTTSVAVPPPDAVGAGDAAAVPSDATDAPSNDAATAEVGIRIGEVVLVQGSAVAPYKVKRVRKYVMSCTCLGWTSSLAAYGVERATCKHIRSVLGETAEAARLARVPSITKSATTSAGADMRDATIPTKIALAATWTPKVDPTGMLMSEKLDGMRAYWTQGRLWSRAGNAIAAPAFFTAALPAALDLDGELFLGRGRFQECVSITRRQDAGDEWRKVQYVVFDAPTVPGGVGTRLAAADAALRASSAAAAAAATAAAPGAAEAKSYAVVHPQRECTGGVAHVLAELARVQALGGEGLMLRSAAAAHRPGRSSDLLKVKEYADDEAVVMAHELGRGRLSQLVGALVCRSRSGAVFKVGTGFSDAQRAPAAAPPVGSVITYTYFELTNDGVPRFPVFLRIRPDVDAADVWGARTASASASASTSASVSASAAGDGGDKVKSAVEEDTVATLGGYAAAAMDEYAAAVDEALDEVTAHVNAPTSGAAAVADSESISESSTAHLIADLEAIDALDAASSARVEVACDDAFEDFDD